MAKKKIKESIMTAGRTLAGPIVRVAKHINYYWIEPAKFTPWENIKYVLPSWDGMCWEYFEARDKIKRGLLSIGRVLTGKKTKSETSKDNLVEVVSGE